MGRRTITPQQMLTEEAALQSIVMDIVGAQTVKNVHESLPYLASATLQIRDLMPSVPENLEGLKLREQYLVDRELRRFATYLNKQHTDRKTNYHMQVCVYQTNLSFGANALSAPLVGLLTTHEIIQGFLREYVQEKGHFNHLDTTFYFHNFRPSLRHPIMILTEPRVRSPLVTSE